MKHPLQAIRRYKTTLAIIGSAIALISFAVREEWSASLRGRIAALNQARIEYDIRAESAEHFYRLWAMLSSPPFRPTLRSDDEKRAETTKNAMDLMLFTPDELSRIDRFVSLAGVHDNALEKERKLIQEIVNNLNLETFKYIGPDNRDRFVEGAGKLEVAVPAYEQHAKRAVDATEKTLKARAERVSLAGIAIFALSWLVSLIASVIDRD